MSRPKPKRPNKQVNIRVTAYAGDRLRYATTILPATVSQSAVLARGIELYIAEAEKMKGAANG